VDVNDLELDYPCRWQFTLFGTDEEALRAAVVAVVGRGPEPAVSKRSAKGTYLSMVLEVEVTSDEERRGLWERLAAEPAVKYVL